MEYTFYFVNNNRVINKWRGCFDNRNDAERFADGAAIGAMSTTGQIGVFGISEDSEHAISREMTAKRRNILFDFLNKK